jgi:putative flippase GtrA
LTPDLNQTGLEAAQPLTGPVVPVWSLLPASVQRRLDSAAGRRLLRFAPAAILALTASQLTFFICTNVIHTTGRVCGASGWLAGVLVSYAASRWVWERRGRPHLLRETLPFLSVALLVGIVLTEVSHFAYVFAGSLNLHGVEFTLSVQAMYIAANFVTFILRFFILNAFVFATAE